MRHCREHGICFPILLVLLLGLSKANTVFAEVVDRVVLAQEDISHDPEVAQSWGEVHTHESTNAAASSVEDIVGSLESVLCLSEKERKLGQAGNDGTVDGPLASIVLLGTELVIDHLSQVRLQDNERAAGVDDGACLEVHLFVAENDLVKVNLPVTLATNVVPLQVTIVVVRVNATKCHLATSGSASIGEVESEHGLVDQLLVDQVVEGRNHSKNRDGVVAQTKDAIKLSKGEREARLLDRLAKVLLLDHDATDLEVISADDTFE